MGLFDVPTSASGGLFTPELQRAAALQGLFAMGNSIGAASQPSPVPGINPFATAGAGATKAYDDFLKNALGMSLLNEQLKASQEDTATKQRKAAIVAQLFGGTQGGVAPSGAPAMANGIAPPGAASTGASPLPDNNIYNDTPQNRLLLNLGLGIDPSKIYSAPTTKLLPLGPGGTMVEAEYRGGRWVPFTGVKAPDNYAFAEDGTLGPLTGGPADPATMERDSYAKERGQAPFKGYPRVPGGSVDFPWMGMTPGGMGGSRTMGAAPALTQAPGSPAAPGPSMRPLPGGGMSFGDPDALGKDAKEKTEAGMVSDSDTLTQLSAINSRFRPEYQTFKFRGLQEWSAFKEKISPDSVSPQDRSRLAEFSQYKSEAAQFFSNTLKALSGAAVTEPEMKRATAWIPNPGTGIFDGDSPTQVKANIDRLTEFTRNAIAKKAYIRERGLKVDGVDVDQMPKIMNDYGKKMLEQFTGEGMNAQQAQAAAVRAVALRFGLLSQR